MKTTAGKHKVNAALHSLLVSIEGLHPDGRNARRHDRKSIEAIKSSLSVYGQQKPIVALSSGVVVAGNGTLEAALELGWEKIAAVTFDSENEARARGFAIMDNRSAELSSWDFDALATSIDLAGDFDTGFTKKEIENMIGSYTDSGSTTSTGEVTIASGDTTCPKCGFEFES